MDLGYHNIEIKTRDILKLNFGIWNIAGSKPDSVLKLLIGSFKKLIKINVQSVLHTVNHPNSKIQLQNISCLNFNVMVP